MGSRSTSLSSATATVTRSHLHNAGAPRITSQYFEEHRLSDTPRKLDDESFLDSGYGSQDSSQVATPDRLGASESASESTSLPKERGIELRLSKTKTLIAFNSRIDEIFTARFYSIQPDIESLLLQYTRRKSLLRSSARHKPMAIRLLLLGNTEVDAKPHIVVFCAPEMRKRVQHFFDTDELVKAFYKPEDASLPSFDVAVCGCAPQLRNGEIHVEVLCDTTADRDAADCFQYKTSFDSTFCGTPICLQANGKTKKATFGGIVKLEYTTGESKLYGLTTAHAVRECLENEIEQDANDGDFNVDDDESNDTSLAYSDSDWSNSDSEGTSDEDLDSQLNTNKASGDGSDSNSWAFEHPRALGNVLSYGSTVIGEKEPSKGFFDWALIDMKECKPNRLPAFMFRDERDQWSAGITKFTAQPPAAAKSLSEDRVILMCGSSGPKFGYLSSQPARILAGPSDLFVDAYMVILDRGDALVDGDSGSWVVTEDTHQVIGHVVATDPLGAGYIIPLCGIFRDIQQSLGVITVSLPSISDIEASRPECLQVEASQESPAAASAIPVFVPTGADPPTLDEDALMELFPEPMMTDLPTPPTSSESSNDSWSDRVRKASGIYYKGQRVLPLNRRGERNRERVVVVDNPPAPREPPWRPGSDSHDSGYSSYGGSSRNSPNYSSGAIKDPKDELEARMQLHKATVAAFNAEFSRWPAVRVPPPPRRRRVPGASGTAETEAEAEADAETDLVEAVKRLDLPSRRRSRRPDKEAETNTAAEERRRRNGRG